MPAVKHMPVRKQLLLLLGLAVLAGLMWVGQERVSKVFAAFSASGPDRARSEARARRAVPVVVERVGEMRNNAVVEVIGTARAERFVTLFPEVSGEVVFLGVKAGDRVRKGDVIVRLDSATQMLAVDLARVKLADAKRKLARSEQLLKQRVSAQASVDDDRTALERAGVELKQAQDALNKRSLRAPFAGVVGIPKVDIGDRVSVSKAITTLDDRRVLLVEVKVPEHFIGRLSSGHKVAAHTPSHPNRPFEGTIHRIDSRVDPASRNVTVRVKFPNPRDLLRPGMSFAVEIKLPGKTYPTVSELALQWSVGHSYVWRIRDGEAQQVTVRSIRRNNAIVLVEGDIAAGDLVVKEGVQRLRPGRKVRFDGQPAPGPAPGPGS